MATLRVGVTGGEGFLGSALLRYLSDRGDVAPRPLNRGKELLTDPDTIHDFAAASDVVVHLAGKNRASDEELLAGNVLTTWNVARAAARGGAAVVFSSSLHVYPLHAVAHTESTAPAPANVYGLSKLLAEGLLGDTAPKAVSLRFCNVYGARARPYYNSGVATFFDMARKREPIRVHGDGSALRDYLYVDDAVRALWRAVELAVDGQGSVYNVASGEPTSVVGLLSALRTATGLDVVAEHEGDASTQSVGDSLYADSTAFRVATGWEPQRSLVGGLRATYEELEAMA